MYTEKTFACNSTREYSPNNNASLLSCPVHIRLLHPDFWFSPVQGQSVVDRELRGIVRFNR
jgi:hypothetical protein